jgi:hypothetical protein
MFPTHYIYTELFQSEHLKQMTLIARDCITILSDPGSRDYILEKRVPMEKVETFIDNLVKVILLARKSQSRMSATIVYACRLLIFTLIDAAGKHSRISLNAKEKILDALVNEVLSNLEIETHGSTLDENIPKIETLLGMIESILYGCKTEQN